MKPFTKLPANVDALIDEVAQEIGENAQQNAHGWIWCGCHDLNSPIEQLFWVHLNAECDRQGITLYLGDTRARRIEQLAEGIMVVPQYQVGPYRVDFMLSEDGRDKRVVVELDGHAFHDRDADQRAAEKGRDRYLASLGYTVLHFTGREIVRQGRMAAAQCLDVLLCRPLNERQVFA